MIMEIIIRNSYKMEKKTTEQNKKMKMKGDKDEKHQG